MKKIIIISFIFTLLSCSKNTSSKQEASPVLSKLSDSSLAVMPLHPDLLIAWDQYRNYGMDGIIDTSMCYIIDFFRNPQDSIARISFNNCKRNYVGYKGMTEIGGYYVAIMDPDNIGKDLYNTNLLTQKDISDFKCYNSKIVNGKVVGGSGFVEEVGFIIGLSFKIKNNRIEFIEDHFDGTIP